jgi:hypothetical protein
MAYLFSPAVSHFPPHLARGTSASDACNPSKQNRHYTWRKLWLNLAIAEKELGLPIPDEAVEQMENNLVRPSPLTKFKLLIMCGFFCVAPGSKAFRDRC